MTGLVLGCPGISGIQVPSILKFVDIGEQGPSREGLDVAAKSIVKSIMDDKNNVNSVMQLPHLLVITG